MKFEVDAKTLAEALNRANSVVSTAGSQAKSFFLEATSKSLSLVAATADTFIKVKIKGAAIEKEGLFSFEFDTLLGVTKGRAAMSFTHDGGKCTFKVAKGRYSGDFPTPAITEDQKRTLKDFNEKLRLEASAKISKSVLSLIREGLRYTSIKDVYGDAMLLSYMTLSGDDITITSYDNYHFALYQAKIESDLKFRIALPSSHFALIDRLVEEDSEASFAVTETDIKVESTGFRMILPAAQVEAKRFTLVPSYLKSLGTPDFTASYDHEELARSVDNLFTLHGTNTRFQLEHKKGKPTLDIKFVTNSGSAADSLDVVVKTDKAFSELLDPKILKNGVDVMRATAKSRQLAVYCSRSVVLKASLGSGARVTLVTSFSE